MMILGRRKNVFKEPNVLSLVFFYIRQRASNQTRGTKQVTLLKDAKLIKWKIRKISLW